MLWKIEATRALPLASGTGDGGCGSHDPEDALSKAKHVLLLAGD